MAGVIQFYERQNIFVTGATGFLGKVLLEKILRSCPDVGNIFVLVRPKKGKEPSERVQNIISLPLFDLIRRERPETLRKIVPVTGDCAELGLGLSATDRQTLEETVSIVFHAAATVRFDEPLKSAVLMNIRGTREVMMIARNMKNLKVFVHVSTVYCNCDRPVVQEIIYPPHADWKDIISIAEHFDEHTLNILTNKILCNLPNTYTFSKSLAEHVVNDLGEDLPVMIFRPSIVISTWTEPFPGWIDNFNGPTGLLIAGGKGILRIAFGDPNAIADYVPVDICIQFMLLAAWCKAVGRPVVQEIIYPPHADWKDIISIAEHFDEHTLNILTNKILCNLPNTYTFSKSLAEHVVNDLGEDLPVMIFRPSIVISTWTEPFPGWIDNFNGPTGLLIAGGKGILRIAFGDPNAIADYVPVDICIQFMLLAAWCKAVGRETSQPAVYNSTQHPIKEITFGEMNEKGRKVAEDIPFNNIMWKPGTITTTYRAWYYVNVIFFHLLPGLLIDGLIKLSGNKPLLVRLHRRIYLTNMALSYFTTISWIFAYDKRLWLRTQVPPGDRKHFQLDRMETFDSTSFIRNFILAARLYLLKEGIDTLPHARRHSIRMYWLDKSVRIVAIMLLLWFGYHSTLPQSTISGIFTSSVFG